MKAVSFPSQQKGPHFLGLDEGLLGQRIVILAHRLPCDDAFCEYDSGVALVGGLCAIQKGIFSSARGPYDKHEASFEVCNRGR